MVTTKKFGLAELERYTSEIGFKNGDVRTIKGVLAIVGIPNVVIDEAQEAIATVNRKLGGLINLKAAIEKSDAEDEAKTKEEILKLQSDRQDRKKANKAQIAEASTGTKVESGEIKRLEAILKKFS